MQVEQKRGLLRPQIEVLKPCAVQNIAIRGHRDDGALGDDIIQQVNDGNFRHLVRFRIESDALKETFSNVSANARYTSKTVQNELLTVMSCMVKQSIAHRINQSKMWSILADETTDRSSREQMVLVARYVDEVDHLHVVREDPFCMIDVFKQIEQQARSACSNEVRLSGANVAGLITNEICKANLDIKACVGQGYDKASAMAG
jgi:hypothetical protein